MALIRFCRMTFVFLKELNDREADCFQSNLGNIGGAIDRGIDDINRKIDHNPAFAFGPAKTAANAMKVRLLTIGSFFKRHVKLEQKDAYTWTFTFPAERLDLASLRLPFGMNLKLNIITERQIRHDLYKHVFIANDHGYEGMGVFPTSITSEEIMLEVP